eukprot:m.6974 g.6974  ORF g.6974 m.6974 type:complete len:91 (+) comp5208_c0_seq2:4061-4333(+)
MHTSVWENAIKEQCTCGKTHNLAHHHPFSLSLSVLPRNLLAHHLHQQLGASHLSLQGKCSVEVALGGSQCKRRGMVVDECDRSIVRIEER